MKKFYFLAFLMLANIEMISQNSKLLDSILTLKNIEYEKLIFQNFKHRQNLKLINIYDLNIDVKLLFDKSLTMVKFLNNLSLYGVESPSDYSNSVEEILILNKKYELIGQCDITGLEKYNKNDFNEFSNFVPNQLSKLMKPNINNIKIIFLMKEIDFINYYIVTNDCEVLIFNSRISSDKLLSFDEYKEIFWKYSWWRWKIYE